MSLTLTERAVRNVSDILTSALQHDASHKAVIIYDAQWGLTQIVADAYKAALPSATTIDFDTSSKEEILAVFETLSPQDLVVMVQSTNFRLNDFRIRLHLFAKKIKVIEHARLGRNTEATWGTYIDALAYDKTWYRETGQGLKHILDSAEELRYESCNATLSVSGGLEPASLNIGDYTGMENVGGAFPIGEVFTEARSLELINGSFYIDIFADTNFEIEKHEPFRVDIAHGQIAGFGENAPQAFKDIIEKVRLEERPIIRELGFGLNRAITRERFLNDITAFERNLGMHFSIGEKHSIYKKPGIKAYKARYHIDVFPVIDRVIADGVVIFEHGQYVL
ncbi:hypothetical protein A3C89_02965 [Candidatus Kaiserbacteria bacterium RIFCSPHIGHO2_02_FULL_50_50]|uniref:Uncharacterized protein n=1 Tax=Candidatus Kaiserbacteria bacterium RIFCSPHIGHO2_02_FULL_50_50 TaxID=1798492 RepID=A0A1F6DD11_9BACT|nr:MAG: hypothetical protein A3C89_02965 [Candidatus Kaiserbacteria bacterium RIFCSPHIGHO2_02_FULL_50_50]OGG88647.1 MAG: hypothetical protein A3G62_00950 [Candidatus Kaiserbacteria bacterium RIFCSPLOWO2_12_FULL_50_10]